MAALDSEESGDFSPVMGRNGKLFKLAEVRSVKPTLDGLEREETARISEAIRYLRELDSMIELLREQLDDLMKGRSVVLGIEWRPVNRYLEAVLPVVYVRKAYSDGDGEAFSKYGKAIWPPKGLLKHLSRVDGPVAGLRTAQALVLTALERVLQTRHALMSSLLAGRKRLGVNLGYSRMHLGVQDTAKPTRKPKAPHLVHHVVVTTVLQKARAAAAAARAEAERELARARAAQRFNRPGSVA